MTNMGFYVEEGMAYSELIGFKPQMTKHRVSGIAKELQVAASRHDVRCSRLIPKALSRGAEPLVLMDPGIFVPHPIRNDYTAAARVP